MGIFGNAYDNLMYVQLECIVFIHIRVGGPPADIIEAEGERQADPFNVVRPSYSGKCVRYGDGMGCSDMGIW